MAAMISGSASAALSYSTARAICKLEPLTICSNLELTLTTSTSNPCFYHYHWTDIHLNKSSIAQ